MALGALIGIGLHLWDRPATSAVGPPLAVVQALETALTAPIAPAQTLPDRPTTTTTTTEPPAKPVPSVEVCGVGRIPADLLSGPAFEATFAALNESAMKLRHGGLSLGDDDWGRAVGLRLDMGPRHAPADTSEAALGRLASLATTTRDPRVYAMAWEVCHFGQERPPHPACASLSARRWAQLDPGNAVPWTAVAMEAASRGEQATVDEAMHQIAAADRVDAHWLAMSAHVLDRLDPDLHPVLRLAMTNSVYMLDIARLPVAYHMITRHCSDDALHDANRRERCTAIKRLLIERGTSALDVSIGAALAQRLGVAPEEVERLRALAHAVGPALEDTTGPPEESLSCRGVQGMIDWARAAQHGGEMAAVRRWAAARGVTPEMMVERKRDFDRQMQAATIPPPEAAASAPTPASPGVP